MSGRLPSGYSDQPHSDSASERSGRSMDAIRRLAKDVIQSANEKYGHALSPDHLQSFARGQWQVIVQAHPTINDLYCRDQFMAEIKRLSR